MELLNIKSENENELSAAFELWNTEDNEKKISWFLFLKIHLKIKLNFDLFQTFANPEDGGQDSECSVNEKVERVRRYVTIEITT